MIDFRLDMIVDMNGTPMSARYRHQHSTRLRLRSLVTSTVLQYWDMMSVLMLSAIEERRWLLLADQPDSFLLVHTFNCLARARPCLASANLPFDVWFLKAEYAFEMTLGCPSVSFFGSANADERPDTPRYVSNR